MREDLHMVQRVRHGEGRLTDHRPRIHDAAWPVYIGALLYRGAVRFPCLLGNPDKATRVLRPKNALLPGKQSRPQQTSGLLVINALSKCVSTPGGYPLMR